MTQQPTQLTPQLLTLPYHADSRAYFHTIAALLPMPLILQSDTTWQQQSHAQTPRGRFDILTAAPEYWLQTDQGAITCCGNVPPIWRKTEQSSFAVLHEFVANIQNADIDFSVCEKHELPFCGGLIGYCSYDLAREFISLPDRHEKDIAVPDMQFGFYGWALIQDHLKKVSHIVIHPQCSTKTAGIVCNIERSEFNFSYKTTTKANGTQRKVIQTNTSPEAYQDNFKKIIQYIYAGDCYQVNYAQRFCLDTSKDAIALYESLRQVMPSPFSGLLPILGCDASIISLSPERFISIDVNNTVTSQPIKGTAKRCDNPHDDKVASESLSNSDKCQSENLMIVDLIRNDLGKCCNIGSVTVEKLFELQSFSNVHHLVSTIKGTLRSGLNGADVLQACFPGGSITGAPKIRAMEIINEVENSRRDIYCGSLVVFSAHGTMDSNILIRTVLLQNGKAYCWAGGGIIADSECQSEYEESLTKVQVLLDAIQN